MRTVRCSGRLGEGGGVCKGMSAWGGGVTPLPTQRQTHPNGLGQTPLRVKTLPFRLRNLYTYHTYYIVWPKQLGSGTSFSLDFELYTYIHWS